MTDPYSRSEWYDQSLPETSVRKEAPEQRRRRSGGKAAAIIACVLVLLVASVYAFSGPTKSGGVSWEFSLPARPESTKAPSTQDRDQYADDFRKFFEEFYGNGAEEEAPQGSLMERTAGNANVRLEIVSAADRQELTLQELYRQCLPSIVGIRASYEDTVGYSWGTGVVLTADGYILTNQHVVEGASGALVVLPDGSEEKALLVGEDRQTDLAVLKIQAAGLVPAEFGDSEQLSVGEHVAAIGNPLGDELVCTMTDGIISALNRDISVNGRQMTLLQTNAALNEGNSGGALYNMYGQVIGITNMKMVNTFSSTTIEGIGFAIPSSIVKSITDQLFSNGIVQGRPGIGVTLGPIPSDAAVHYSLPDGLYVYAVAEGSDALKQGLKKGDIVTHVNGQEVRTTEDVLEIRDSLSVGDAMVLRVWREGKDFEISVTLVDQNEIY